MSALVTFFTFFGIESLHDLFLKDLINIKQLNFVFSLLLLALLIASFLQITLRLGEEALGHLSSVRALTDLQTDLDDLKRQTNLTQDQCARYVERLNDSYKSITHILPANSDSEWRLAKKKLDIKGRD